MSRIGDPELARLQAVLLVGGKGTRLSGVIPDRPKAMAEVAGVPFLEWILSGLFAHGIRRFIFCTGYLRESIETHLQKLSDAGMEFCCSPEEVPLGTGGALRQALPLLDSDPVFVLNGDSWCDFDAPGFLEWHRSIGSEASLVLSWAAETARYGSVEVDANHRIVSFREKDPAGPPGWINAGVYLLSRSLIATIPPQKPVSLERDIFPRSLARGIYGFCINEPVLDIGTPESYQESQRWFEKRQSRLPWNAASLRKP